MSQPHYIEFIFNKDVESLIQNIDLNETDDTGNTLLGVASYHNDYQTMKLLLQKGANANLMDERGNYPLNELLLFGENKLDDPKILVSLELLLKAGANPNIVIDEKSLLDLLIEKESPLTILEILLKYGADPDFGGSVGWHPITSVMGSNDHNYIISVIDLLLRYNADINIENIDNHTPLTVASLSEYIDVMKFLLDQGTNINHQNSNGNTSLMEHLNYQENVVGFDFLLTHGADVNLINNNGETALQIAINNNSGNFQIPRIKKLLDYGAHKNEIYSINIWKNLYDYMEEQNEINEQRIQEILELKKCDLGTILEKNIGEYL